MGCGGSHSLETYPASFIFLPPHRILAPRSDGGEVLEEGAPLRETGVGQALGRWVSAVRKVCACFFEGFLYISLKSSALALLLTGCATFCHLLN